MIDLTKKDLDELSCRVEDAAGYLHIANKTAELEELEAALVAPDFWNDPVAAQQITKRASDLRETIRDYKQTVAALEDLQTAFDLAKEDESFADEVASAYKALQKHLSQLEMASWFGGKFDGGDAIVSVNPGAGGLEAQDWTEMLYRMYTHYAERKGWKVTVLDLVTGEGIGLDKVTFQIEGKNAYGMLRSENGVHRLVRISPTDANARRHTTFAAVQVMPVLNDDLDVELNPADVRVDVFRASGPGGQCVNTTDSAVRLTHIPTGIVVSCQDRKSQLLNKEAAFKVLRGKLYEIAEEKRAKEVNELRGDVFNNEFGSQIRNYVLYPYKLVKDARSGVETGNTEAVLEDGDLDAFVLGYHKWKASL